MNSGFNLPLARACFRFADLAYEEVHEEDRATSTQVVFGGWADDPDAIFVGIRGTKEIRDVITDARFAFKAKWPGSEIIRIHRGVAASVAGIIDKVIPRVEDKKIYVVGHSLGGMIALPIALRLRLLGANIVGVQTFGSPRVGNGCFRNAYNALLGNITLRWEAQGDPFPWSPPLLCGYRHAGRAAYLKNDGRVIVEPELVDHIPAFVETLGHTPASMVGGFINLFDPHNRTNYAKLLKEVRA